MALQELTARLRLLGELTDAFARSDNEQADAVRDSILRRDIVREAEPVLLFLAGEVELGRERSVRLEEAQRVAFALGAEELVQRATFIFPPRNSALIASIVSRSSSAFRPCAVAARIAMSSVSTVRVMLPLRPRCLPYSMTGLMYFHTRSG